MRRLLARKLLAAGNAVFRRANGRYLAVLFAEVRDIAESLFNREVVIARKNGIIS